MILREFIKKSKTVSIFVASQPLSWVRSGYACLIQASRSVYARVTQALEALTPVRVAFTLTLLYLAFLKVYQPEILIWTTTRINSECHVDKCVEFNQLGDLLAGVFSPLAFIWLACTAFMQRNETRSIAKLQREDHIKQDEYRRTLETRSYIDQRVSQYLHIYSDNYDRLSDILLRERSIIRHLHSICTAHNASAMGSFRIWKTPTVTFQFSDVFIRRLHAGANGCAAFIKGRFISRWVDGTWGGSEIYETPSLEFDMWLSPDSNIIHSIHRLASRGMMEFKRISEDCEKMGMEYPLNEYVNSNWQLMMVYSSYRYGDGEPLDFAPDFIDESHTYTKHIQKCSWLGPSEMVYGEPLSDYGMALWEDEKFEYTDKIVKLEHPIHGEILSLSEIHVHHNNEIIRFAFCPGTGENRWIWILDCVTEIKPFAHLNTNGHES